MKYTTIKLPCLDCILTGEKTMMEIVDAPLLPHMVQMIALYEEAKNRGGSMSLADGSEISAESVANGEWIWLKCPVCDAESAIFDDALVVKI